MKSSLPFLTSLAALAAALPATAQEHAHLHANAPAAPGATTAAAAGGPVRLTQTIVRNLGLETAEARLEPMEKTLSALGAIEAEPARVTTVASRVPGRVTRLAVRAGQRVQEGEFLFEIESRIAAEPPPRLTFRAPRDAVLAELSIAAGGPVEPDRTLLTLIDLTEVEAVAQVFEAQIGSVKPGQAVRFTALAYPDSAFSGRVKDIAPSVNRETGTVRVFVQVPNPDGRLLPGMRGQLAFVVAESDAAVVVPRAAILGEAGDFFVFRQVLTGPFQYERAAVELGLRNDRLVEIINGVLPGDRVVTRGNYQLQFVGAGAAKVEDDHSHGPGGHQH